MGPGPQGIEPLGQGEQALSIPEALEDRLHQRGLLGDRDQDSVLHPVAEGGRTLEPAPAGLLRHAALDLLGQIDGIILIHGLDDGLHEDAGLVVGEGFADGDDLDAQLPAEHGLVDDAVLPVAGEAGELPEEHRVKGLGFGLGQADHLLKGLALSRVLPADALVQKDKFVGDDIAVGRGILPDLDQLGVRGVFGLILRGDPDIGRGDLIVPAAHTPASGKTLDKSIKQPSSTWTFSTSPGVPRSLAV